MSIDVDVQKAIKEALKAGDRVRLDAARMTRAAFKNFEIEKKTPIDDANAQKIIAKLVKQRHDSAEQFRQGGE